MIPVKDFKKEVIKWAEEIGVEPREIHVRPMRKKWASCSSRGRLSFSYALLAQPEDVRSYAIVHELLHLKYPTHNKLFKRALSAYLSRSGIKDSEVIKGVHS